MTVDRTFSCACGRVSSFPPDSLGWVERGELHTETTCIDNAGKAILTGKAVLTDPAFDYAAHERKMWADVEVAIEAFSDRVSGIGPFPDPETRRRLPWGPAGTELIAAIRHWGSAHAAMLTARRLDDVRSIIERIIRDNDPRPR